VQLQYVRIKSALFAQIETGQLKSGDKVASENQLSEQFSVSRMTARRALTELVDEGILFRSQGAGTFVSDHRPMSSMLTIRSIDEEIRQRGHHYSNKVVTLTNVDAEPTQAALFGLVENALTEHTQSLAYSRIIHFESQIPVQVEDRWVHPQYGEGYLQQDFTSITANQYLNKVAPLTEADHSIEAIISPQAITNLLDINKQQPCLLVSRRSYSTKGIVSFARLYHPGNRYRIGGHLDFHSQFKG
jgi:GntR family histidine utilization transcriptional repressor